MQYRNQDSTRTEPPNIHSLPTLTQLSTDTALLSSILLLLNSICGVDQGFLPILQDPDDAVFDLLVCFLVVGHEDVIFQGATLCLSFLFREAGIGVLELLVFFVEALTSGIPGDVKLPQAPVEGYEACRLGSQNGVLRSSSRSKGLEDRGRCHLLVVGGRFRLWKSDEYGVFGFVQNFHWVAPWALRLCLRQQDQVDYRTIHACVWEFQVGGRCFHSADADVRRR